MSDYQLGIIGVTLYKISILACGLALSFLGYKMSAKEIEAKTTVRRRKTNVQFEASLDKVSISIKDTIQGIAFSAVGMLVIIVTILRHPPLNEETIVREKGPPIAESKSKRVGESYPKQGSTRN